MDVSHTATARFGLSSGCYASIFIATRAEHAANSDTPPKADRTCQIVGLKNYATDAPNKQRHCLMIDASEQRLLPSLVELCSINLHEDVW
jgi:hypothetical protein